jgi:hypothetical protein
MDVIPLDATLVKGSHGRPTDKAEDGPLFITSMPELLAEGPVAATGVKALLLEHLFATGRRHERLRDSSIANEEAAA